MEISQFKAQLVAVIIIITRFVTIKLHSVDFIQRLRRGWDILNSTVKTRPRIEIWAFWVHMNQLWRHWCTDWGMLPVKFKRPPLHHIHKSPIKPKKSLRTCWATNYRAFSQCVQFISLKSILNLEKLVPIGDYGHSTRRWGDFV